MNVKIRKGCDIRLTGASEKVIADLPAERVAYTLSDFPYIKPKVVVKEGDKVQKGTPLFFDKKNPDAVYVSPIAGSVEAIVRGDRRVLLKVIIKKEGEGAVQFDKLSLEQIEALDADGAKKALLSRGLWPFVKRRPFLKVALVEDQPTNIFVNCLDSNPLAADPNFYLDGRTEDFNAGIALLAQICSNVHVCQEGKAEPSQTFTSSKGSSHRFSGKHPRGNTSVHIENIAPVVRQDQVVWTVRAQEVVAMGKTLLSGQFDAERTVAWAGPAASEAKYYRTTMGASVAALPVEDGVEVRRVSGSVLSGREMDDDAFVGTFDNTVIALKEGREKKVLGWLDPGFGNHSLTRCYASSFMPFSSEVALTTTTNGEHRAIVDSEMYDKVQPLDIHTAFLFKSLLCEDIEEAERLGLWSVSPEDFALATYMDPSKNDFAAPLVKVLDTLHKEES